MYEEGTAGEYEYHGFWVDVKTPFQIARENYLASLKQPDPEKLARIAEGKKRLAKTLAVPILFSLITGA